MFLPVWVISIDWSKGWIIVVWALVVLVCGSIIGVSFGGLPGLGLGLRSCLLFNSTIKNLEKAWYLETYEASCSSWTWFCCERGMMAVWLEEEESILLISSIIVIVLLSGCWSSINRGVGTYWSLPGFWRICSGGFLLYWPWFWSWGLVNVFCIFVGWVSIFEILFDRSLRRDVISSIFESSDLVLEELEAS